MGAGCGFFLQPADGFDASLDRHVDIHQDDIGFVLPAQADRFQAVAGFANQIEPRLVAQDFHQAAPEQFVVIRNEDSDQLIHAPPHLRADRSAGAERSGSLPPHG